jgi:hypothetical protein
MSKDFGTKWDAPLHTIAKIEMLRKYLRVWLSIVGSTFPATDLWYIDGFAGPGEYTNYPEGSPVAALGAADEFFNLKMLPGNQLSGTLVGPHGTFEVNVKKQ